MTDVASQLRIVTTYGIGVIGIAPNPPAGFYGRDLVNQGHGQTRHVAMGARREGHVTIADELQAVVVELVDLSLIVKQLSWDVSEPAAGEFRAALERLASQLRLCVDDVAARMLTLGHIPNGQSRALAIETNLAPLPARRLTLDEARAALEERLRAVTTHLSRAIERLAEDPPTIQVLIVITSDLEHHREATRSRPR